MPMLYRLLQGCSRLLNKATTDSENVVHRCPTKLMQRLFVRASQWPSAMKSHNLQGGSMNTHASFGLSHCSWVSALALTGLLVACGGHQSGDTDGDARMNAARPHEEQPSEGHIHALALGATLNRDSLAIAEQKALEADPTFTENGSPLGLAEELSPGRVVAKSAYRSGAVARKAAAVRIPLFRFFNRSTGAHFFTTSASERDHIVALMSPPFSLDGEAFSVASGFSPGLSPVHRFHDTQTGVHFYTISDSERAHVVATMPQFNYEGVAYHASLVGGQGLAPVYRFFAPSKGLHFYTASEAEKDNIIARLGDQYVFEGVGYYALDSAWRAEKLPHTGVTDDHCFREGTFVEILNGTSVEIACSATGSSSLNPQQDGHRTAINPMYYSEIPNPAGGHFARTECVRDNVTGLIWEGKEQGGTRGGTNTYDNLLIRPGDSRPDNSIRKYVGDINQLQLCGFSDWRLPTRNELLGIGDYGRAFGAGFNTAWFPNTSTTDPYWTEEVAKAVFPASQNVVWDLWFSNVGPIANGLNSSDLPSKAARLVRGNAPSGPRFSYSSITYGSDEPGNVVNDAWTGLQWRRCEQGQVWRGGTCAGTHVFYTHQAALAHARDQSGWRLPNIKELSSLTDLTRTSGALIDPTAFPGAVATAFWSSSPTVDMPGFAWSSDVVFGQISGEDRNHSLAVRLVRLNP